jgi:hypothetical protein
MYQSCTVLIEHVGTRPVWVRVNGKLMIDGYEVIAPLKKTVLITTGSSVAHCDYQHLDWFKDRVDGKRHCCSFFVKHGENWIEPA